MADIVDTVLVHRASMPDATAAHALLAPLATVSTDAWRMLADRAVEPNGYYLPDWELAVDASARGRTNASALTAWRDTRLTGMLPVISLWRAWKIPTPIAPTKAAATRAHGHDVMQQAAKLVPALVGGSADLEASNKTRIDGSPTPATRT